MLRAIAEFVLNTTYSTGSFLNVASRSVGVFVGAFLHRSNWVTSTSAAESSAEGSDVFIGKRGARFNVVTPTAEDTPRPPLSHAVINRSGSIATFPKNQCWMSGRVLCPPKKSTRSDPAASRTAVQAVVSKTFAEAAFSLQDQTMDDLMGAAAGEAAKQDGVWATVLPFSAATRQPRIFGMIVALVLILMSIRVALSLSLLNGHDRVQVMLTTYHNHRLQRNSI